MSFLVTGFSHESPQKIAVVGAGVAGLTAAYRLHQAGMDVEVYEARSRVGGRILSALVDGRIGELGGQNIADGGEALHLCRLIDELGLVRASTEVSLRSGYFDGERVTPVKQLIRAKNFDPDTLKTRLKGYAADSANMQEVLAKLIDPKDPLYKIIAVRLAAYEGGAVEKLSPLYWNTLYHMLLGGICSVHQSNGDSDVSVDFVSIEGGNALLPEKIAEALGSKIHLNRPLKQIAKDENGIWQLIFEKKEVVRAEIVVLAIPCSVYEEIDVDGIPRETLNDIRSIQYGQNAKILIPFNASPSGLSGVGCDEFVSFFDSERRLFTTYYCGHASRFSPDTIENSCLKARPMIEMAFPQACPPFATPRYAEDATGCSYEGPVGYSWPNDPYVKGTYSYIARGQESLLTSTVEVEGEVYKRLFAPIGRSLYFAGEHASILTDVPGTMEAACESGERIARAILNSYNSKAK